MAYLIPNYVAASQASVHFFLPGVLHSIKVILIVSQLSMVAPDEDGLGRNALKEYQMPLLVSRFDIVPPQKVCRF